IGTIGTILGSLAAACRWIYLRMQHERFRMSPLALTSMALAVMLLVVSTILIRVILPLYPPVGWKLAYSNPMKSNNAQVWAEGSTAGGACEFTGDIYKITNSPSASGFEVCEAKDLNFSNFALETEMDISKGDQGAVIFRE